MPLGDLIERALSIIGITSERVQKYLGDCGCCDRQERLNSLSLWATRVLSGRTERAEEHLRSLTDE
jgi:hypothetical protein